MATHCIGIDLGGTFIKAGVLDGEYRLSGGVQVETPSSGAADVVGAMASAARQAMHTAGIDSENVLAVGIGAPGPLSISEGVIHAMPNIPGMVGLAIRDRVSEALSLPAVLENDANAAAYGEYICGAGRGSQNIVMLTLGTGVGSGIVIDGRILHGSHEIGAELGHMIVQPDGEQCGCGQQGCLEQYASAGFTARHAERRIREGAASSLRAVLEQNGAVDAKDINEARRDGDELATAVWERMIRYLAIGCVSICRIFDPDRIVLAGGMTRAGDDLLSPLRERFVDLHWSLTEPATDVAIATLGSDAGVIGAAGVAWSEFSDGDDTQNGPSTTSS